MTIAPATQLPAITEAVTIDGTVGASTTPVVTLDGVSAPAGGLGLRVDAGESLIKNLALVRFGTGVFFNAGSGSALESSYVGIATDGSTAQGNTNDGVVVSTGASATTIGPGNVISGNTREGIHVQGSGGATIRGNRIGTNAAGTAAIANGLRGILFNGSSGNVVGGTASGAGNVISGNLNVGILVNAASNNTIRGTESERTQRVPPQSRTARAVFSFSAAARPPVPMETRSVALRWAQGTSSRATPDLGSS